MELPGVLNEPASCIPPADLTLSLADEFVPPEVELNQDLSSLDVFSEDFTLAGKSISL